MSRVFLIDTDTASDDAVALIMALRAADVRVAAITVVAGNVDVKQATRNALYTAELCGSKVPIFSGADKPLVRRYQNATGSTAAMDWEITIIPRQKTSSRPIMRWMRSSRRSRRIQDWF